MLPAEVTKFIGQPTGVRVMEVEKGAIRKFADAMGDPNPLYYDEEYARKSKYGCIIAPPGFFGWSAKTEDWQQPTTRGGGEAGEEDARAQLMATLGKLGYAGLFDGGTEYDFFLPVRPGDVLVASSVIKDVYEREGGRYGKMVFTVSETTYINQNGDVVAKARGTGIRYPLPPKT